MESEIKHTHIFVASDKSGFEVCAACRSYRSAGLLSKEELYLRDYWSHDEGRSTMREQVENMTSRTPEHPLSKIDKVFQHLPPTGKILEIACAPGIFMREAKNRKYDVTGIEPDWKNVPEIKGIAGHDANIVTGFFPDVSLDGPYDAVVSMDVFEHIENYQDFAEAVYSILSVGGRWVFMSPILLEDGLYRERDFIAQEHAWIFTEYYLSEYLGEMFSSVEFDRWKIGHEICVCQK